MKKFFISTEHFNELVSEKLKKYLLFISIALFFVLGSHLLYIYIYDGAESEAEPGGTISEAIIGTFPHFNPLVPSNDHNAYINGLLYRSILEYSPETGKLESDLASCNTENLLSIDCVLESNLEWSNGEPISSDDIAATLNLIRETKVNPIIASLLEKTKIETHDNIISFKNSSKDINFLQVFLQPIIPKSVVETLNSENVDGKFSEIGGIYSGRFVLTSISQDETIGITKITLGKNEKYNNNPLYIQFLILNLFRDEEHFLKNKNSFNIFNDKEHLIGNSIPRLQTFEYTLSQFVGNFFNTETVSKDMRLFLSQSLDRDKIIESVGKDNVIAETNPFLIDQNGDSDTTSFDVEAFLEKKGYYSKKELLKSALEISKVTETPKTISPEAPVTNQKEKKVQQNLVYITSPTQEKYNFISEDNILIKGKVDANVDAVYINDYKLSGFSPGDDAFYYRLIKSYDSIKEGENTYTLSFETNGKKKIVETFVYIYEPDSEKLETLKKNFFDTEEAPTPNTPAPAETPVSNSKIKTTLTPGDIEALADNYFYDTEGKPYTLNLIYAQSDVLMEKAAQAVKLSLNNVGITINMTPLSLGDISVGFRNDSLNYDILLIGVNLGYFGSNIYPYFHSSQVKNGYNFSNFKKLSLDILLEELTGNALTTSKQEELQFKMVDILKEEAIVKVLYTPKIQLLVDKNIKNFNLPSYLPDSKYRYLPLIHAYLSEKKTIQTHNKSFWGFFSYLVSTLFS